MTSRTLPLLACLYTISLTVAFAQTTPKPPQHRATRAYGIDFWRDAEGFPQSRIRAITQTRDGYIWLGTDNGLVRFNGAAFTAFTVETGTLKDNEVWALREDDEGGLWIGTYGGGLTLLREGRFRTFTTADGLPDDVVMKLDKDAQGNIWIATPNGVCRHTRGSFTSFTTKDGLSDNLVTALTASPKGLFVATGARLHRLANGRFELINGVVEEGDGWVASMITSRDGSVWLACANAVVKKWQDGTLTTFTQQRNQTPHINQLYEALDGTLWATSEQGLYRLLDGKFEAVPIEDNRTSLGVVYSVCIDREGSVWIGLQSNGLGRLRLKQLTTLSADDGLLNDSTRSVFQDSRGDIWIGTAGGFAKYRNGQIESYTTIGSRTGVRSFAEDREGNILLAAGRDLYTMKDGKLSHYPDWQSAFEIEVVYRDGKDRIWVGTDGAGVFQLEPDKISNLRAKDGLGSDHIRSILFDSRGDLWISTAGQGVTRYSNGQFKTYGIADGLAGTRVLSTHEDEEGALWFATRSGLSRLKDGKFSNFTSESGLLVDFVYAILDDGAGNFWFSCAQGLFRVRKSELRDFAAGKTRKVTSVEYGVRDGMRTRAFNVGNQPTALQARDGSLMFCSLKGVVIVDQHRLSASTVSPPVYIENVLINKEPQQPGREVEMPLGAGEVEISYAALSYVAPEKVRFRYMLEGYDGEWVDAGARRFAYYASLRPGHYRFRVMARNLDGNWNEAGAAFAFYLRPRFYQTSPFLGVVLAALALVVWLVYRLRVHGLRVRYSAVLAERNRIAGEIHDTLAQNLAGIALQLDSVTMQLSDVPSGLRQSLDQACNLTRYSLSEARRAVTDLRSDELERRELAEAVPEIAAQLAAGTDVETRVEVAGTPRKLNPMTEKNLLRIFQEAMANAIKHARATTIEVELKYDLESLALRVRDDGSGFDTGHMMPLEVGHYGLTGMRERAERIGGRFTLKSRPGEGTELLVEVPLPT